MSVPQRPDVPTSGSEPEAALPPRPDLPDPPPGSSPGRLVRVPWKWWEAIVVAFLSFLVGSLVGAVVATPQDLEELSAFEFTTFAIGLQVGIIGTVLGWLFLLHREAIARLDLRLGRLKDALVGAGAGLGLWVVAVFGVSLPMVFVLKLLTGREPVTPDQIPQEPVGAGVVLMAIPILIGAPVAEELLFRGAIFRGMRSRWGFLVSAAVSGVLFGLVHYDTGPFVDTLLLIVPLSVVGFGLAWIYERRANLLAPIAAHAAFNCVGYTITLVT